MATKTEKKILEKKGYQIPAGEIINNPLSKDKWILGESISIDNFVEVYSVAPCYKEIPRDYKDYPNVIKIERDQDAQLFAEINFYMWNCKSYEIDSWQKKKKLIALGMPNYVASGLHEYRNKRYRFLVINRYGDDLWKIFVENYNRQFPEHIVYKLALQIIDILEYIHHKNYVHGNIKGENLLLGLNSYDQVYLIDFGLAFRCTSSTELKVNPKKTHIGTLEYMSRDAHMGVQTRRGDIEILNYNMLMWLCGSLPWEKLNDPASVQKEKEIAFSNIYSFLGKCFNGFVPQTVYRFMTLLDNMKFNEIPSYEKLKKTLITGLKKLDHKPDGKLKLNIVDLSTQKIVPKSIPQKINTPNCMKNSRENTTGVGIDKKVCNIKAGGKALDDIGLDCEYDIQIKKVKTVSTKEINNATSINVDSENGSNIEPLSERSNKTRQEQPVTNKLKLKIKYLDDGEIEIQMEKLRLAMTMD